MKNQKLTIERLKSVLDYDPKTGIFTWLPRYDFRCGWNQKLIGKEAGRLDTYGYRQISVDGKRYLAHRLSWFYMTGIFPEFEIDHKNTKRDDNRFENLREATHAENGRNRGKQSDNTSGHKGVYWNKNLKKWQAAINVGGKSRHLGVFRLLADAVNAYEKAAMLYHGEYARVA